MLIEYRTLEGHLISYHLVDDRGVTIEDIDALARQYYEKTGRQPYQVVIAAREMARITQSMAAQTRYQAEVPVGTTVSSFMVSCGQIFPTVLREPYLPVFVGSNDEYRENDMTKLFEEIVLKDAERV